MISNWRSVFEKREFNSVVNKALSTAMQYTEMIDIRGNLFQTFTNDAPGVIPLIGFDENYKAGLELKWIQQIPEFDFRLYCIAEYHMMEGLTGEKRFYIMRVRWFGYCDKIPSGTIGFFQKISSDIIRDLIKPLEFPDSIDNCIGMTVDNTGSYLYCPYSKTIFVEYEHPINGIHFLFKKIDRIDTYDVGQIPHFGSISEAYSIAQEQETISHYEVDEKDIGTYS